jgi:hypothetical protein
MCQVRTEEVGGGKGGGLLKHETLNSELQSLIHDFELKPMLPPLLEGH